MTATFDLVIRAARVMTGGADEPGGADGGGARHARAIGVRAGRIAAVFAAGEPVSAREVLEFDEDVVVLPGLVDSHVHVCEPGHADWEGFATATRAAGAGGITTLVDMPLDSVPSTVSTAALQMKRRAAETQCHVDVGFWGGVVPGNLADLPALHGAGVLGFKCFLSDSGTDDFPPVDARQLTAALRVLRELGTPLLVHAESPEAPAAVPADARHSYAAYLAARPKRLENAAVSQVIEAARATGGIAHVVHVSSSDALPMLAAARAQGVRVTAETCPHYLILAAEEIADGATAAKCSPPVREAANRELLWQGLRQGVLDLIASDHSPCTAAMKELRSGDFGRAWGGVSSLQLSLPLVWTAARQRGYSLRDVVTWMSLRPARLAGLRRKGKIAAGYDADFCVLDPDEVFTVDPRALHHRHAVTPYAGRRLHGVVRATLLRGRRLDPEHPRGQLLARDSA